MRLSLQLQLRFRSRLAVGPSLHARARPGLRAGRCVAGRAAGVSLGVRRLCLLAASLAVHALGPASALADAPAPDTRPRVRHESFTVGDAASPVASLRLTAPTPGVPPRTPVGDGWRHDFDIVLSADGDARIVRDGARERFEFVPVPGAAPVRYVPRDPEGGSLTVIDGEHVWRRRDGSRVEFAGSVPVRMVSPSGGTRTLRYAAGRLDTVEDAAGPLFRFAHPSVDRTEVTLADGSRFELARGGNRTLRVRALAPEPHCPPSSADEGAAGDVADDVPPDEAERVEPTDGTETAEEDDETCDTASDPPPDDFADGPGVPGAIRVDARPASCRSYFVDYRGTARGSAIERGLDGLDHYVGYAPTVRSFPIVDFVGAELRVVRSRDLARAAYDTVPDGLYERLLRDGDEIAERFLEPLARDGEIGVTELGRTTTIARGGNGPIVLELVVRAGLASPDQILQIERARLELLARHAIELRVVEIP